MKRTEIASLIDHTLLKGEAIPSDVGQLCEEARRYQFATVCVNPVYVPLAAQRLLHSGVGVSTVIGFPLGAATTETKLQEARQALENGATELDMVIHLGALRAGEHHLVQEEIAALAETCHADGALLKVIIEAPLLADEEKGTACRLARDGGADYVKTSTGFCGASATVEDVRLMRETVGAEIGVKAAGGVRTYEAAMAMIDAGASRIGTSSGVAIAEQAPP